MNLDFLNEFKLKNKDLNEKLEFLIPDFLVKKAITIIYANGGSGPPFLKHFAKIQGLKASFMLTWIIL